MDYQPSQSGPGKRLRVICGLHIDADDFVTKAPIPLDVFRDHRGRWCVAPKEEV